MRPRLFCDLLSRALIGACDLELFRYPEMTGGEFAKNDPNQPPPLVVVQTPSQCHDDHIPAARGRPKLMTVKAIVPFD